jgi:hypothetical protein
VYYYARQNDMKILDDVWTGSEGGQVRRWDRDHRRLRDHRLGVSVLLNETLAKVMYKRLQQVAA